jgi:uncharacterized membrane protein SirB2
VSYLAWKHLHLTCVLLSGLGFALRGVWMLNGSSLLEHRWSKRLPHVIDTLLLGSALVMVAMSQQFPFVEPWLTAKVFGLLIYIGLGTLALKRGTTRASRAVFLVMALLAYAYIVGVALTRSPWLV